MDTVYIILANPSGYDVSPYPIGFVTSEKTAVDAVARLNQLYTVANSLRERFNAVLADVPYLRSLATYKNIPKWPPGTGRKDITEEMQKERDEARAFNAQIDVENTKLSTIWNENVKTAVRNFINDTLKLELTGVELDYVKTVTSDRGSILYLDPYSYEAVNKLQL